MFHFAKISVHLISLVLGVGLLIYIKNQTKVKSIWPKIAAWFVIAISVLSILCSYFWTIKLWNSGYMMDKNMYHHHDMKDHYYNQKAKK